MLFRINLVKLIGFMVVAIILCSNFLFASENSGWDVINSTPNELVVSYKPDMNGYKLIKTTDGSITYLPNIKGAYNASEIPGVPSRLEIRKNFVIPEKDGFYIKYVDIKGYLQVNALMTPAPSLVDIKGIPGENYSVDRVAYNNTFSDNWVVVKYEGIARDKYLASINITAAQYDNGSRNIEMPTEVVVAIGFKDNGTRVSGQNNNDEGLPFSSALNYNETKDWVVNLSGLIPENLKKSSTNKTLAESAPWYRITVENEGVYKLDASYLASAGISIPKEQVQTIKLYSNGGIELSEAIDDALKNEMNEQSIIVNTKSDGSLESIIFYGMPGYGFRYDPDEGFRHYKNTYSPINRDRKKDQNFYFLTWGGSNGKRASALTPPDGPVENKPMTYTKMIFEEEDFTNAFDYGSGRVWFGASYFPRTFTNTLQNLDRNGQIFYRISAAHKSDSEANFKIYENNNLLGDIYLGGLGDYQDAYCDELTAYFDASKLPPDNRSNLKLEYQRTLATATPYFDFYEIQYPCNFVPVNNKIEFFSDPDKEGISEYSINNFSGNILGFDVTDPADPKLLTNLSQTGGLFVFKTATAMKNPGKFFISSEMDKPVAIDKAAFADLRENQANTDVIVITHPDLLASARKFKEYRESHSNLTVSIFRTDQIFNEFGSGIGDPTAIRDFIARMYSNWSHKPKYILLWGDGHYDYKNITTNDINYVPTYENKINSVYYNTTASYTSDDYFGQFIGNDVFTEVGIGRITVDSPETGDMIVNKIDHYENNSSIDPWRTSVTLMADDSPKGNNVENGDGDQHTSQSEGIAETYLPQFFQTNKIYLVEYPRVNVSGGVRKPAVMEDMISTVNNKGNLLLSWIGHGNPRVWAHEEVFERSITIPQLVNMDKLFFLMAATCDFGRFDMTDIKCGSEELMLSKIGGAIGVLSSTRLVYSTANYELLQDFVTTLTKRLPDTKEYPRLGDVMFAIKQQIHDNPTNDAKFYLLGDPTMRLLIPQYDINFDEINGTGVSDNKDTAQIEALSNVIIKGHIKDPKTGGIASDFNGTVVITMLDSDNPIIAVDIDKSQHHILKHGGILNKSSYKVVNGEFTADFVVPKDISFSNETGRLYGYSYTNDNRFAKGETRAFRIGGIDTTGIQDNNGPDITLYLDSRSFSKGAFVSPKPLFIADLADSNGINTTGSGIGHRIEAWIDDSPESIDLTSKFSTSLEDSRSGSVEEVLTGLEPGLHKIKLRAWDVFNNYSVAETYFRIATDGRVIITGLNNFPNPVFSTAPTIIRFTHNLNPPYEAVVNIFTVDGNLIKTIHKTLTTLNTGEVEWDGYDKNGYVIPSGAYPYQVTLYANDGSIGRGSSVITYTK